MFFNFRVYGAVVSAIVYNSLQIFQFFVFAGFLMANSYEVPSWAGKPPPGLHLDISKEDPVGGTQKFIQKIMIDEKKVNETIFCCCNYSSFCRFSAIYSVAILSLMISVLTTLLEAGKKNF